MLNLKKIFNALRNYILLYNKIFFTQTIRYVKLVIILYVVSQVLRSQWFKIFSIHSKNNNTANYASINKYQSLKTCFYTKKHIILLGTKSFIYFLFI